MPFIQGSERIEKLAAIFYRFPCGVFEVEHRLPVTSKFDALMVGGQETTAPKSGVERLGLIVSAFRQENHKSGQIRRIASQPVTAPRSETWPARLLIAGLKKRDGGIMIDSLGMNRFDHTHIVGNFGMVREEIAEPHPAVTVLSEWRKTFSHQKLLLPRGHTRQPLPLTNRIWQLGSIQRFQCRFMIKEIDLRGRTTLKHVDNPFGLGSKMRQIRKTTVGRVGFFNRGTRRRR